ncbi:hypothetical protein FJTKL_03226 [Diaporthe vaccinii]|uniref:Uncharacterized protein n=1 Tax=Diaporthe vaccinii TaxID=105482 RepID=A0ABR4DVK0_9PEZI
MLVLLTRSGLCDPFELLLPHFPKPIAPPPFFPIPSPTGGHRSKHALGADFLVLCCAQSHPPASDVGLVSAELSPAEEMEIEGILIPGP